MTESICPYCPYQTSDGKTHDPLTTQRDKAIHATAHRVERARIADWLRGDTGFDHIVASDIATWIERGEHIQ